MAQCSHTRKVSFSFRYPHSPLTPAPRGNHFLPGHFPRFPPSEVRFNRPDRSPLLQTRIVQTALEARQILIGQAIFFEFSPRGHPDYRSYFECWNELFPCPESILELWNRYLKKEETVPSILDLSFTFQQYFIEPVGEPLKLFFEYLQPPP